VRKQHGFTLVELALAATLLTVILGAVAAAITGDSQTSRVILSHMGPELKGQRALEAIASELRMAGEWGEDLDHDGVWDDGEDANGNGSFDANWNLADGTMNQDNIAFNRRIDEFAEDGTILTTGIYSRPVKYRLDGEALIREWQATKEDGTVEIRKSAIATKVGGLRFSRQGQLVRIELDVLLPENVYKTDRRTVRTMVWLRN
jgi:type II secretory pathway component PulJ